MRNSGVSSRRDGWGDDEYPAFQGKPSFWDGGKGSRPKREANTLPQSPGRKMRQKEIMDASIAHFTPTTHDE